MTSEEKFAEQRQRNRTVYAIEDFHHALASLSYAAIGNLLAGAAVGVGWLLGADNLPHLVASVVTAVVVWVVGKYVSLEKCTYVYGFIIGYLASVVGEYLLSGLPAPIFPHFTVEAGWVGFAPFANSLFPLLYPAIRLGLGYALINVYLKLRLLRREPISRIRQIDRDLAGRLE